MIPTCGNSSKYTIAEADPTMDYNHDNEWFGHLADFPDMPMPVNYEDMRPFEQVYTVSIAPACSIPLTDNQKATDSR